MTHKLPSTFTCATDPSHGWLIVTLADLAAVGLTEADISPYSYRNGDCAALEEDCDASTFIEAYRAKTGRTPAFKDRYAQNRSRVRSWASFGTKKFSW